VPQEPPQHRLTPTGDIRGVIEMGVTLQKEAGAHNIHNVFDDGGYKELILLRLFELRKLDREGDDAEDRHGRRFEIKTVARVDSRGRRKGSLSVTTEHTLTIANIERYRRVYLWIIAVFDQSRPEAIYEITPRALEPYFAAWEQKLLSQEAVRTVDSAPTHINNPKIPLWFIKKYGIQIWPPDAIPLPEQVKIALDESAELKPAD
jgi:hypothetical protein